MRYVHLGPDGPIVSQLGFGTGRLNGSLSARKSAGLVSSARDLGITYFDTAPSYGMGDAERILGTVLAGDEEAVIATKVGPHPTTWSSWQRTALSARSLTAAQLRRSRVMRRIASPEAGTPVRPALPGPSRDQLMRSLETSLRDLRRSRLDLLLLHDVDPARVSDSTISTLEALVSTAAIGAWGFGVSAFIRNPQTGRAVWQTRWPGASENDSDAPADIYHSVLRDAAGGASRSAVQCMLHATASRPGSVFLASSNTRSHLAGLVTALG